MMMSVLEHASVGIAFHVLGDRIGPGVAETLDGLVRRYRAATVTFHDASGYEPTFAGCSRGWFRNTVPFARLMIPDRFPEMDHVMYVDTDTLMLGDIGRILEVGTGRHGIAAAPDICLRYYVNEARHRTTLGLPPSHVYFNNGLLLIDCRWWRRERALEEILSIARDRCHDVRFPTQDPMNIFFSPNRYTPLPQRSNCIPLAGRPPTDALMLHFAGEKPWEDPSLPTARLFQSYAERSPFADAIRALAVQGTVRRRFRRAWRSVKRTWHTIGNKRPPRSAHHG